MFTPGFSTSLSTVLRIISGVTWTRWTRVCVAWTVTHPSACTTPDSAATPASGPTSPATSGLSYLLLIGQQKLMLASDWSRNILVDTNITLCPVTPGTRVRQWRMVSAAPAQCSIVTTPGTPSLATRDHHSSCSVTTSLIRFIELALIVRGLSSWKNTMTASARMNT